MAHSEAADLAQVGAVDISDLLSRLPFMPRLTVVKTKSVSMPVTCRHCEDAPCVNACPNGAVSYREKSVQIDQSRCVGCKSCMLACPYGAINVVTVPAPKLYGNADNPKTVAAQARKCDLCLGRENGPACVSNCPTKALRVMDEANMEDTLRRRREAGVLAEVRE